MTTAAAPTASAMAASELTLYHYWRSTSSWRVRLALDAKGITPKLVSINLLENQSETPEHLARNPMGYVPVLETPGPGGKPRYLSESLAIIGWLEATYPQNPLLPPGSNAAWERARVWQLAELINAGTQPLLNLGVGARHSADPAEQKAWNQDWARKGLQAYETIVRETAGRFSFGDTFTLADICLIPHVYSAARNDVTLEAYPTIARIQAEVAKLPAYASSHPDRHAPPRT